MAYNLSNEMLANSVFSQWEQKSRSSNGDDTDAARVRGGGHLPCSSQPKITTYTEQQIGPCSLTENSTQRN